MNIGLRFFFCLFLLALSVSGQAKLLDQMVAVFNDQMISLSEIRHIQTQLKGRSKLARNLFPKKPLLL